uniref:Uncharacterized protein n=1 Tax=Cannabis sativa TaxID=3483 RepID=A0A803PKT2_CANSA
PKSWVPITEWVRKFYVLGLDLGPGSKFWLLGLVPACVQICVPWPDPVRVKVQSVSWLLSQVRGSVVRVYAPASGLGPVSIPLPRVRSQFSSPSRGPVLHSHHVPVVPTALLFKFLVLGPTFWVFRSLSNFWVLLPVPDHNIDYGSCPSPASSDHGTRFASQSLGPAFVSIHVRGRGSRFRFSPVIKTGSSF